MNLRRWGHRQLVALAIWAVIAALYVAGEHTAAKIAAGVAIAYFVLLFIWLQRNRATRR